VHPLPRSSAALCMVQLSSPGTLVACRRPTALNNFNVANFVGHQSQWISGMIHAIALRDMAKLEDVEVEGSFRWCQVPSMGGNSGGLSQALLDWEQARLNTWLSIS
jgi:hypothetical protein